MVLQEAALGVLVLPGKSAECLFYSLRMSCLYLMFSRYISLYLSLIRGWLSGGGLSTGYEREQGLGVDQVLEF